MRGTRMIEYRLIRSRRKTVSLSFDENVRLVVKAPSRLTVERINAFVESKADWIEATRRRLLCTRQRALRERPKLETGDILPYLGDNRVLTVVREARSRVKITVAGERIIMCAPYEADYEQKRTQLEKWYRKQAIEIFEEKGKVYAPIVGVKYNKIHVKDQKSRWGSCSGKGNLNFNWRLIMAPEAVLDYVVIHELCHLIYMNHSPEFWKLVEKKCPAYKEQKRWLKINGEMLYQF